VRSLQTSPVLISNCVTTGLRHHPRVLCVSALYLL